MKRLPVFCIRCSGLYWCTLWSECRKCADRCSWMYRHRILPPELSLYIWFLPAHWRCWCSVSKWAVYATNKLMSCHLILCETRLVNSTNNCTHGEVRLVNGSSIYEGRLEICINGDWGTVCDKGWDTTDATTVCKQLGYAYTGGQLTQTLLVDYIITQYVFTFCMNSRQCSFIVCFRKWRGVNCIGWCTVFTLFWQTSSVYDLTNFWGFGGLWPYTWSWCCLWR